jgi:hypothetical protein
MEQYHRLFAEFGGVSCHCVFAREHEGRNQQHNKTNKARNKAKINKNRGFLQTTENWA